MAEQRFTAEVGGWYGFSVEIPLKGTGSSTLEQLWDGDPRRGGRLVYDRSQPEGAPTITFSADDLEA